MRLCFVCLGNICRSPLAEGVFAHQARAAGLDDRFHIESAGLGGWHVGEPPDPRARQTARAHGVELTCVAQQFRARDFARFDLVLALDQEVADDLRRLAPSAADREKVRLLREYDPAAVGARQPAGLHVPDPYYGGLDGFETAYQMIERSCQGLLQALANRA